MPSAGPDTSSPDRSGVDRSGVVEPGVLARLAPEAVFALAVAVGTAVRLDQIADQIPAGDEWHALHALLRQGYGWIFTHFGQADHSIPLTLYDKLLSDTIGLSEMGMRAPVLIAGIASLWLLPYLLRPWVGRKASVVLAWLLAISPLHVYFSRFARPYSVSLLLSILAAIALDRWLATGHRRWAAVQVVSTALAAWFHPVFLPFLLAPFVWAVLRPLVSHRRRDRDVKAVPREEGKGGRLWPVAAATAALLCLFLGPPVFVDFSSLARHSEGPKGAFAPLMKVFDLLTGQSRPLLAFGFGIALVLGVVAHKRRWGGLAGCLLFSTACQAAGLLVLGPSKMEYPIIQVRYVLPALVVLLLVAAVGLEHLDGLLRKEWRRVPPHTASLVLGLSLLWFGPLPAIHYRPNNWTNHAMFQYEYSPAYRRNFQAQELGLREISPFYLRLAKEPPSPSTDERIVEAPWYLEWYRQPFAIYQRVHRRKMLVGFVGRPGEPTPAGELPWPPAPDGPRFRFRNFVHVSDLDGMRERNVRYLIFHRDPPSQPADAVHPRISDAEHWARELEVKIGPPVYEDHDLCVFDLKAAP